MSTQTSNQVQEADSATTERRHWGGPVVGGFYLVMAGVHLGLVSADTETYRHFADAALLPFVRDAWQEIFMPNAAVFGLLLMAGELALGILLLLGGRCAAVGWVGVIAFHVALMIFGFAAWIWCIPALVVLVLLARRDNSTTWAHDRSSSSTLIEEDR